MSQVINISSKTVLPTAALTQVKAPWTSDRYGFVSTSRVVEILATQGWTPIKSVQARSNKAERVPFAKHSIDLVNHALNIGDSVPMIRLINSHDSASAFWFLGGIFRLACENGLLAGDTFLETFKVHHAGKDLDQRVYQVVAQVAAAMPRMIDAVNAMRDIELNSPALLYEFMSEVIETLEQATGRRYEDIKQYEIKRPEDAGDTLWVVFNRIQENILDGNARQLSTGRADGNHRRIVKARAIRAIDRNTKVNQALFDTALRFVNRIQPGRIELKQA